MSHHSHNNRRGDNRGDRPGDDSSRDDSPRDPFRPPAIPCEVQCLHCGWSYESWQIEWRGQDESSGDAVADIDPAGNAWCCPTPGCDGVGFGFDIFPTDPDWADEHGEKLCAHFEGEDDEDDDEEDDGIEFANPFGTDRDDEEEQTHFAIDAFEEDAFWIDAKVTRPRALGNTPQPPFDALPPTKLYGSTAWEEFDDDDIPF